MGNLKTRIRISSTIKKENNEWLQEYSKQSLIPYSKLLDKCIELLKEEVAKNSSKQLVQLQSTLYKLFFSTIIYKCCNKNKKVLVAIQDLQDDNVDVMFVKKMRNEYQSLFEDVKTAASLCDDLVKQLRLFTEKQNIPNVEPRGFQKIILINEGLEK